MTFDEFVSKHKGKAVDHDNAAGRQCVDLAEAYFDEVFGSGIKNFWFDAHHFYELYSQNSWLKKNFERIPNTPEFVPQKGDVAVWGGNLSSGGWGHIAICTGEGDTTHFYSYDQNWTGNGDPCTKIRHSYCAFLGVLRPKDQTKVLGKPKVLKTLDTAGLKYNDKSIAVLALKQLMYIAKAKGWIKSNFKNDYGFGSGTQAAVNELLAKFGYKQNGIAGDNFVKLLGEKLK